MINENDLSDFAKKRLAICKECLLYKNDPEKTHHIGFIADDTDESIAGENHDRMDVTNCIGVLIKAIQELNEKIIKLENRSIT